MISLHRKRFFIKNFISVVLPTVFSILLVGIISIIIIFQYIHRDIQKSNINLLSSVKNNVEFMVSDLDQYTLNFSTDPNIIVKVKQALYSDVFTYEMFQNINIIQNFINTPVNARKYLHSVYIYYNHYNKLLATDFGVTPLNRFYDRDWVANIKKASEKGEVWIEPRDIRQYEFEKQPVKIVSFYKKFFTPGALTSDGVVTINLRQDYINNLLGNLADNKQQTILVADSRDSLLFFNSGNNVPVASDLKKIRLNSSNVFSEKIGDTFYQVNKTYSTKYDLCFISLLPESVAGNVLKDLMLGIVSVILAVIIIGSFFAYAMTKKNHKQLMTIINILEQYETTREFPEALPKTSDEYDYIVRNILKTFIENDRINRQLIQRKHTLEIYELKALQMQLNPHFLYNTLETINWQSLEVSGKHGPVNRMIENLSNILKYCLTNAEERISILEEIKYTKCYTYIQSVRYSNRFRVIWEYFDEVLDYKILKLFFQPLLENSIHHGVISREKDGLIKIKIELKKETIKITIIDNGIGMDKAKLEEVRSSLKNQWQDTKHIGLINTNQRIRLLYGEKYCIRINSKKDLGTVQYLEIPKTLE